MKKTSQVLIFSHKHFFFNKIKFTLIALVALLFSFFLSFGQKREAAFLNLSGKAQGTSYFISYKASINYSIEIDSIFASIDKSLSLWDTTSTLVLVNRNQFSGKVDAHFEKLFSASQLMNKQTEGYFDIRVGPLVNAWGFGRKNNKKVPTSIEIDSLKGLISRVELTADGRIVKENLNSQLDFNAIAQGYTVDVLASFLKSKKVKDYLVEVGGEVIVRGKNKENKYWKVGIEKPQNDEELEIIIKLKNKALNTSGSYRNYWEKDGVKYSHAIDPFTGYPVKHDLLSVSVIAKDCMTADAYATAFLVMGLEKAKKIAKNNKVEFFAIYDESKIFYTKGFKKHVQRKSKIP